MKGTAVENPLETKALGRCFQQHRTSEDSLYVGAVKSNVNHLKNTNNVTNLIKAILILKNKVIFLNINFEKINFRINLKILRIYVYSFI